MLYLKAALFTLLVPGTVTVYLPLFILQESRTSPLPSSGIRLLCLIPIGIGATLLLDSIWRFAWVGRGTLVSWEPPKKLVVQGLYRYVRNPMYLGILIMLLGEAGLYWSRGILEYTIGWFVLINGVILLYEEPKLRKRFAESYEQYCLYVSRWIPGTGYTL